MPVLYAHPHAHARAIDGLTLTVRRPRGQAALERGTARVAGALAQPLPLTCGRRGGIELASVPLEELAKLKQKLGVTGGATLRRRRAEAEERAKAAPAAPASKHRPKQLPSKRPVSTFRVVVDNLPKVHTPNTHTVTNSCMRGTTAGRPCADGSYVYACLSLSLFVRVCVCMCVCARAIEGPRPSL
jgi:hypothetical protein